MRVLALSLISGGAVVFAVAVTGVWWHHRRRREPLPSAVEPRSLVRMLGDDEELRQALERAARFEHAVEASLRARATRYEAMLPTARVTDIRTERIPQPQETPGERHSA